MKRFVIIFFLSLASSLWAAGENATLTANTSQLLVQGGEFTCTAAVSYPQTPDAIGWIVPLPKGWSIVSTSGPNIPEVSPPVGADTGEWAFIAIPGARAQFSFVAKYPAGAVTTELKGTVILRGKGEPVTLSTAGVKLEGK